MSASVPRARHRSAGAAVRGAAPVRRRRPRALRPARPQPGPGGVRELRRAVGGPDRQQGGAAEATPAGESRRRRRADTAVHTTAGGGE